mmetsp:Transcript_92361/g.277181  ORF Transcript_92361/g.277181 Transcript_92361/m.277181 type:complete len:242 (-) Transcript_92361:287-1012(-)
MGLGTRESRAGRLVMPGANGQCRGTSGGGVGLAPVVQRLGEAWSPLRVAAADRAELRALHLPFVLHGRDRPTHQQVGVVLPEAHQIHAAGVVPPGVEEKQRALGVELHLGQRRRVRRARKVNVGCRDADVLPGVVAGDLGPLAAVPEPRAEAVGRRLAVRADHVVTEKVEVLVLAINRARAARVGEDEEVGRAVGRLPRRTAPPQPLQALLLRDRRPTGKLAPKQNDDARARLAPVVGDKR